ncbi:MAG: type III secretion system chaperone [Duodenibacillus sp.]|nr:type III secretion system chaperone [Duodenibacillus sp.]
MLPEQLVAELGTTLAINLSLSDQGTCRVVFDEDEVDFEKSGNALFVMADIASACGREDAYGRLLTANCLGNETGGAVISLDAAREVFVLHTVCEEGTSYPAFEAKLTLFVKALRYWKAWLAQPVGVGLAPSSEACDTAGMLAI